VVDLADVDAARGELAIEQCEPGGVSCTKRTSSLTVWSWSASKPTCSL
jgi:hypothetical protein